MTKTYSVTIRDNHGEIFYTRTVECTDNQDPAEIAVETWIDENAAHEGLHVSSVVEVV